MGNSLWGHTYRALCQSLKKVSFARAESYWRLGRGRLRGGLTVSHRLRKSLVVRSDFVDLEQIFEELLHEKE